MNPASPHYRKDIAERRLNNRRNEDRNKANLIITPGTLEIGGQVIDLVEHEELLREGGVPEEHIVNLMADLWLVADERR